MADEGLTRKSAVDLAALMKARAVSPVEVLNAHLAVIERLNPKLNAIVTLATDTAREAARAAEQAVMTGSTLGSLHGLPIGIKDITLTADHVRLAIVQGQCAGHGC
jgi:amidase